MVYVLILIIALLLLANLGIVCVLLMLSMRPGRIKGKPVLAYPDLLNEMDAITCEIRRRDKTWGASFLVHPATGRVQNLREVPEGTKLSDLITEDPVQYIIETKPVPAERYPRGGT